MSIAAVLWRSRLERQAEEEGRKAPNTLYRKNSRRDCLGLTIAAKQPPFFPGETA
jgi:hypothetical protein